WREKGGPRAMSLERLGRVWCEQHYSHGIALARNPCWFLRSQRPQVEEDDAVVPSNPKILDSSDASSNGTSKVHAMVEYEFWTFVDMASEHYLWRHFVSNSSKRS
ncbi:hypothetical protein D0Y65_036103, partial [Glycine soja]